jgi:cytochrome c
MAVGAFLGTVFVLMSVSIASEGIFHSAPPEKPGFAIIAEEGTGDAPAGAAAEAEVDIKPLLASADANAGEAIFKKCGACHTVEKGGPNKVGPNLWGVVERPIASHEGFSYSAGMKTFAEANKTWTYDHLSYFIEAPKKHVPGTAMGFAGLKKPEERASLIAWLRGQADAPVALPEASAAAAPAAAPAPAAPAAPAP